MHGGCSPMHYSASQLAGLRGKMWQLTRPPYYCHSQMRIADCEKSSTVFVVACRDGHDCCPIEMPAMPAPRSWAERLKKPNLKNRTRSLPPRTSSQQALAQRRSGAKYVASSAPSHIRMPRVGALESPQRSKWWHSDMRCGQDKRKSAASPHQSEPRVCSLSVFYF